MTSPHIDTTHSAKSDAADVAVIVVNYGTADLALQAVDSVLMRDHRGLKVEVHLVDNASPGDDAARLARALEIPARAGQVTFYPETTNHGFGRGNNLVLRALAARPCAPHFVFLLNPDARLKTDTLADLAAFLDDHPQAAVVGAGIDRPDGGSPVTAAFRFPCAISEFSDSMRFGPLTRLTSHWTVALPSTTPTQQVDWVSGAALMARLDVLKTVNFFDPDFFLYFEETELMHRLHQVGWETWYCAEARIEHVAGASTGMHAGRSTPRPADWFDSWRFYFCKTQGLWGARLCALARLGGSMAHAGISILRRRQLSYERGFPSDFTRKVMRPLFYRGS